MTMTIGDYVKFVGERLLKAQAENNRPEMARLMRLLIDTLQEKLPEVERG